MHDSKYNLFGYFRPNVNRKGRIIKTSMVVYKTGEMST